MNLTTHWIEFQYNKIYRIVSPFVDSESVVNVGCGGAYFFNKSIKLDITRNDGIDIIGDANHLPLKDKSMAIVFEKDMLHHVASPSRVLDELRRVGFYKLVLVEANKPNFIMRNYFEPAHMHFQFKKLDRLLGGSSEHLYFSSYPFVIPHFFEVICSKIRYEQGFTFNFINTCFKLMDKIMELADTLVLKPSFIIYVKHIQEK